MSYRVAIAVHGRFYAFDLARALLARGHDVWLFTNYPKWAVTRFGFPSDRVQSCPTHGISSRVATALRVPGVEPWLHHAFGRWAAKTVTRRKWDSVYCFSGVAEELFRALDGSQTVRWLIRASTHIRAQAEILTEEEARAGVAIERPSPWMIGREEREYAIADQIVALSRFAMNTFPEPEDVVTIPLAVQVEEFRPTPEQIVARMQRIASGSRLRVLFVGSKSFRKGLIDLVRIARELRGQFDFRFVGPTEAQACSLLAGLGSDIELIPKVLQAELPAVYAWGDIFVFPTIEDGSPVVLAQAYSNGLPILATTNCSAPDFIKNGTTGWILPIRSPEAFIDKLIWCDHHRPELALMVTRIVDEFAPRTWDDVARDYEAAMGRSIRAAAT